MSIVQSKDENIFVYEQFSIIDFVEEMPVREWCSVLGFIRTKYGANTTKVLS
jgi:hypothetical protein